MDKDLNEAQRELNKYKNLSVAYYLSLGLVILLIIFVEAKQPFIGVGLTVEVFFIIRAVACDIKIDCLEEKIRNLS